MASKMTEVARYHGLDLLHVHYAIPHSISAYLARQMLPADRPIKVVTTLHGTDITVVGTGYVGLVTGACLADFGIDVTCVDNDHTKIDLLLAGEMPIYEPGLDDVVERNVEIARRHARDVGVVASYALTTPEALAAEGRDFDVVLSMEVVEHVPDVASLLTACACLVFCAADWRAASSSPSSWAATGLDASTPARSARLSSF